MVTLNLSEEDYQALLRVLEQAAYDRAMKLMFEQATSNYFIMDMRSYQDPQRLLDLIKPVDYGETIENNRGNLSEGEGESRGLPDVHAATSASVRIPT